ncbi:MAG: sulfite exporter TauE/SafE family protein [Actinomycetota bacterium]|nr:sulfite exporter TauE/SafE family protein [Actinomycetota bacterium]
MLALSTAVSYPAVGVLAGMVIGLTGMGGGVLLTPVMVLVLKVPANVAVANDLLISLIVKPFGTVAHHRAGTVRRDIVRRLVLGSVPAAFLGAVVVNIWLHGDAETIKLMVGITLSLAAAAMVARILVPHAPESDDDVVDDGTTSTAGWLPAATVAVGAIGGLLVGITSVGSGSLMLVLLTWLYPRLTGRELVGTDLTQAIPLVASAVVGHLLFGDIRLSIVVPVVLGAIPGVLVGSRLSSRMHDGVLRPVLAVLVGASGLRLAGVI